MEKIIRTERLLLRPLVQSDAEDVFEWVSDPVVNRYLPYSLYKNIPQVEAWIASLKDEENVFAFCLKDTGKVIGSGDVSQNRTDSAYGLCYNLNRAYWGKGYATEAAKAMIQWAYTSLGVRDFTAQHANANPASGNVIRKCGFQFDHYGQCSRFDGSETFEASCYTLHLL